MKRQAVIYTRFSPRPSAKECTSNEMQQERCLAYCNKMNYGPCMAIFDEANTSGGDLDRPRLTAAIKSLNPGDILIVDSSDRLARDVPVHYAILSQIEKAGATVEYANGQPAEQTPEGKLIQGFFALLAAYERDRIRLKTKVGLAKKKAEGIWLGKPPIGFEVDPETKQLVENEREQRAIKRARLLNKMSHHTSEIIASRLNSEFGGFRGKPWSARTVRKILSAHTIEDHFARG